MSSISTVILRNKWQWLFYTKSLTATVLIHSQWRWLGFLYTASNGECFMQSHCRRPFSIQSQWRRLFLHNKHLYNIHLKLRTLKNLSDVFDTLRSRYIKLFIKYCEQLFKLALLKIDNLVSHLQSIFILWDKENNSNMYISNLFCFFFTKILIFINSRQPWFTCRIMTNK